MSVPWKRMQKTVDLFKFVKVGVFVTLEIWESETPIWSRILKELTFLATAKTTDGPSV